MISKSRLILLISTIIVMVAAPVFANDWRYGGKLALTGGVSSLEGSAGGGMASWAVISGGAAEDGPGADAHLTDVSLPDFELRSYGAAVGLFDRLELSLAHQAFDTGAAGARLGLGRGFTFGQTIVGAKLRVAGDAVFDQDRWTPQISVGIDYKSNDRKTVIRAVGGRDNADAEVYVAASKLFLTQGVMLNGAVRFTRANQTGLLGFGGDRSNAYRPQFEGSAALMLNRRLAVGAEYRTKPDNLRFARENDWKDLFVAYAPVKPVTVTLAYVDLGSIATFRRQRGLFLSLKAGF